MQAFFPCYGTEAYLIGKVQVDTYGALSHHVLKISILKKVSAKVSKVSNPALQFSNFLGLDRCKSGPVCECDPFVFNSRGQGNCNRQTRDSNGREWCYLERSASDCSDARPSRVFDGLFLSNIACDPKPHGSFSTTVLVDSHSDSSIPISEN